MRAKIHAPGLTSLVVLATVLVGCATLPPPIQLMDRAQSEIRGARNAGAASTAPDALAEAERRLAAAQELTANNDNGKATDKAEEAEAAAATARARADVAQLDGQIRQQTRVNAGLQADLERRQAAAAAAQQAAMAPLAPAASAAAPASSSSSNAPVTLPSIQLDQPAVPASAGTPGGPGPGVNP